MDNEVMKKKMNKIIRWLYDPIMRFFHNTELKRKLHRVLFEPDTPCGRRFERILLASIIGMVLVVTLGSVRSFPCFITVGLKILEYILLFAFSVEYLMRIYCSPSPKRYIFSFLGIIDMLATVPFYVGIFLPGIRDFLIVRVFRVIRVLHVLRLRSIIEEGNLLLVSMRQSINKILVFFLFVVILVLVLGTVMYIVEGSAEGSSFSNIPNSIYWAIVTMTTVGYGDITPITPFGRFLSAVTMLLGYTIIAVPTGIVSVQMHNAIRKSHAAGIKCPHCGRDGHREDAIFCWQCGHTLAEPSPDPGDSHSNNKKYND